MNVEMVTSGFVGALFGVATALVLDWNRTRLSGRNAARLLFFELATNGHWLWQHAKFGITRPAFLTSAWEATRLNLTGVLTADEFRAVTKVYLDMDELVELGGVTWPSNLSGSAQNLRAELGNVGAFLARRGWSQNRPQQVEAILSNMLEPITKDGD